MIAGTGSDIYSCDAGAIGALRGPKHGGANEVAFEIQQRYAIAGRGGERTSRRRVAAKEVIIGFGHPGLHDRRSAQRDHQRGRAALARGRRGLAAAYRIAERIEAVMQERQEHVPESRLVFGGVLSSDGRADRDVHAAVRDQPHVRLGRARHRAAHRRQDHPAERELHRPRKPDFVPLERRPCSGRPQREFMSHDIKSAERPAPDASAGGHRRLRARASRSTATRLRDRALLPDGHARLRFPGAEIPGLHQAARAGRSGRRRCTGGARVPGTRLRTRPGQRGVQHRRDDPLARLQRHLAGGRVGASVGQPRRHPGGRGLPVAQAAGGSADGARRAHRR